MWLNTKVNIFLLKNSHKIFFLSHMSAHNTLSECWLTLCEYARHVDAPEWSNGREVSVTSCGRVKMALQRLGEHSSSVVWHVNGSHTRVWAKHKHTHTHTLKIENFLQPQGFFSHDTQTHGGQRYWTWVRSSFKMTIIHINRPSHHRDRYWPPGSSTCMNIMSWLADSME